MPLILAIEPDRKQAARVGALARELPGAELVLADSAEQALASLDGRVPNLILTSLLLSPKDESGLHALNGSGASVPTLMIPVFATAALQANERSGFLARLPWSRPGATSTAPGTTGCDPAVFASQIWEYLQSTAPEEEPAEEARLKPDATCEQEDQARCPALAGLDEEQVQPKPDSTPAAWEDISLDDDDVPSVIELSGETIDLRTFVQELEAAELEFAAPAIDLVEVVDVVELDAAEDIVADVVDEPAIADSVTDDSVIAVAEPVVEEPLAPRVTVAHALPEHASWPPLEGLLAEELSAEELLAIVAEFDVVLEDEPENPGNADADSDLWMPLSVGGATPWPRLENACSRPRALQDEWGFFDPEQCGFSALIAKLDHVAK